MKIAFAGFRHGHIFVLYEMAKNHSDYEIVGAFEELDSAKNTAIEKGVTFNYSTYRALLDDKSVEVVAIGSAYGDRGQMAIEALKAGKHVICDKPLCTSLSELNEIEKLSKQNGLTVSCMFTMRFDKKIASVKKLIESGKLGKINNVYFGGQHPLQYGRRPSWYFEKNKHGGVINDIAIHGIDTLSYLFGGKVEKINGARCWNAYAKEEPEFLDSAQFMLTLSNGAGVIADVSYAIPDGVEFKLPYYWQYFIWGTEGMIGFSLSEKQFKSGGEEQPAFYYVKGNESPIPLEEFDVGDYLTDFLRVVNGEDNQILPMSEVLSSTRATLEIQRRSNDN
ncbi:MAG: Gfo/Idh/MocA family oxidoreductase [Clostridia bacterium]|nr:Gfo/Idh/MocA family oxidoreductase [Clostridia bacterium]